MNTILMHRIIMNAPPGLTVDHIDGDKLNNQRGNLRIATQQQNSNNRGLNRNNKSGYKGVYWNKEKERWAASIGKDYGTVSLGYYDTAEDAAAAYAAAALNIQGEYGTPHLAPGAVPDISNRLKRTNTSGYKGVCWHKSTRKWAAVYKGNHLGYFHTVEDAALAYASAAKT